MCRRPLHLLAFVMLASASPGAFAGGGPENVALIVNQDSWASVTIANHYQTLRSIPESNVIRLEGLGAHEQMPIASFRQFILGPILTQISQRGLAPQIDYIVYSSDFPHAIHLSDDIGEDAVRSLPRWMTRKGSINGLTYQYRAVMAGNWATYMDLRSNYYAARRAQRQGFRSSDGWSSNGRRVDPRSGATYLLSTVLGVTSGRGNSIDEVQHYLGRAAAAEDYRPTGTVYMLRNGNVRSTTRQWAFRRTVSELTDLGVNAKILEGVLPQNKPDVIGAVVGASAFQWSQSQSTIAPGAICEHLTSLGGDLRSNARQTPLTEFLRHGAAGASGTVTEPYAIQAKFPTSLMHVSYASGCSLAEAFYQSVTGPYQLLIVGDPLCQPWAERPGITIEGFPHERNRVSGVINVRASISSDVDQVQWFVDGIRVAVQRPSARFVWDTRSFPDGPHELRAVAIAANDAQTQGRSIVVVDVKNRSFEDGEDGEGGDSGGFQPFVAYYGKPIDFELDIPGAERIELRRGGATLASVRGDQGVASIPASRLGIGKVRLSAVAIVNQRPVRVSPIKLDVRRPATLSLENPPSTNRLQPGLLLTLPSGSRVVASLDHPIEEAQDSPFVLRAYFKAVRDGLYQIQASSRQQVTRIEVDGSAVRLPEGKGSWSAAPLSLKKGWHRLALQGRTEGNRLPEIRFGERDVLPLHADQFSCPK